MRPGGHGISILVAVMLSCGCTSREAQRAAVNDPLGPNAGCYVCHMGFVREELSVTHLQTELGCIDCHGLSAAHANDEDIGATPPDVTYTREQVDPSCRGCHGTHDVPPGDVVARWRERFGMDVEPDELPEKTICTDCHGEHRIEAPAGEQPVEERPVP